MRKLLLLILIFSSAHIWAQDLNQIVPESSAIKHGVLKNGMTYYICKTPEGERGNFYVVQRTGSLVEQEGEYGLAHFVEHLVFCGTKNYEKRTIIDNIQKLGIQFGQDLNAGTGYDMTMYKFENVPLNNENISNECLSMLRDMIYFANLEDSDIDKERNVIVEETLARWTGKDNDLLKNTPFARPVMGDTTTILNCSAQKIRDFYHRWYQPQMQAIVVIGPFDANLMLAKIKKVFESIPRGTTPIPERASLPILQEKRIVVEQDNYNSAGTRIELQIQLPQSTDTRKNTLAYHLPSYVVFNKISPSLLTTLRKLENIEINCLTSYSTGIDNNPILQFNIWSDTLGPKETLSCFIKNINSILHYGFPENLTKEDKCDPKAKDLPIKWEPAESILTKLNESSRFKNCYLNFLYGDPLIASNTQTQIDSYFDKTIDKKTALEIFKEQFSSKGHTYIVRVPKDTAITKEELLEIINSESQKEPEPLVLRSLDDNKDIQSDSMLQTINPTEGTIISDNLISDGAVREIIMSNGVKVLINKSNNPYFSNLVAFREGGLSVVDSSIRNIFSYLTLNEKIINYGYSNITADNYDDYTLQIGENEWNEALRYLHYKLTDINIDTAKIYRNIKEHNTKIKNKEVKRFMTILLDVYDNDNIRRDSIPEPISSEKMRNSLKEYKSNYNGMVVAIDCNCDIDSIIPSVKKYLGSLPYKPELTKMIDNKESYLIQKDTLIVDTFPNEKQNGIIYKLFQDHELTYTPENVVLNSALKYAFLNTIINSIRLENGDIYSPYIEGNIRQFSHPSQTFTIYITFAPEKTDKIVNDLKKIINEMAYGEVITQQIIDDFIKKLNTDGGIHETGSQAVRMMNQIKNHGVVINTNSMDLQKVVTPNSVRKFLQNLIEKGHTLEYRSVCKEQ